MYELLQRFDDRYSNDDTAEFDYIITENGISDDTDVLRDAYIIEHLLALQYAKEQGIPVRGYIHWTISDNWEWADGYCPKFGLVSVNRSSPEMKRTVRDSYYLYQDIATKRIITKKQRADAWKKVQDAVAAKRTRPFCRAKDGITTTNTTRAFSSKDWRFTKTLKTMKSTSSLDPVVLIPGFTSSVYMISHLFFSRTIM